MTLAGCGQTSVETNSPTAELAPVSGDLCVNRAKAVTAPPGEVFVAVCLTDQATVRVIGSGFMPNEMLSFGFESTPGHRVAEAEAAAQADDTGRIDVEVVGAKAGELEIEGDAGSVGITGYFDVDADIANAADVPPAEDVD